jgi:uncharacterized BrkB/YihY/UPF0761 family membrane protein
VAMLLGLAALSLLALAARPLLQLAWTTGRVLPGPDHFLITDMVEAFRVLILLGIFTLVYAVVPRGERLWRAVFVGAGAATAFFLIAEALFGVVSHHIWDSLSLVYGPLALAALLLSWVWYVALITLVCGSLASHVKVMILEHASASQAGQRHVDRGAHS